jgi:CheY-like chemotaxis protein
LAHELRNPLAPIRNAVQLLRMLGSEEPGLKTPREIIDRNVNQMVRLVDDLLDVSRITRGKIRLQMGRINAVDILGQALEISRPWIDERGHRLTLKTPDRPVWINGDAARLAQVVSNLLNNAAKYTDPGGQICVSLETADGEAVLKVRDNGVGMAPEMLEEIFGLFTQVDRSPERAQGGLGIGLTLVRKLVEMQHGRVEAHSAGLGQGSEFAVYLPLLADEAPALREPAAGDQPVAASGRLRVLAVDDNMDAASTLALLIQISGHDVRTAHDGPSALAAAQAYRPDVILLDIGLPGLDGYEVAQRLRAMPIGADMVLVALTGYGQDEDRRRSIAAGFDHHLVKPASPQTLMKLLGACKSGDGRAN